MTQQSFISFGGEAIYVQQIEDARVAVLPIYYEVAPSFGSGAGQGPGHLLQASHELECLDEETLVDWRKLGIHTLPGLVPTENSEQAMAEIENTAARYIDAERFLLSLGGDHAITIALSKAVAARYPEVGVLQIDAHLDLRDHWNGSRYNHACVMRRIGEDLKLPFVQVGIRSFCPEEYDYIKAHHLYPFYAHNLNPADDSWMDDVVYALPDNVYMSIDLDGLDPSVLPGTGTPVPGGMTYRQVVELIRRVGAEKNVVAGDINELAKVEGSVVSEFTAAKLATKVFVYCV
ncbi:MAG: agmatinase [Desulfobacterales bacterium]|nr:agmatinase [Desulfobacterales bacterium]MBS3756727.1 agmatinase [Desulfobacterales bacterium]